MIPVEEALARVLRLAPVLEAETVPLREAHGRVLARALASRIEQPPFRASTMDGYAVRSSDARPGASLLVHGEAAAGRPFDGEVGPGEAVRIFTGAPVPEGLDRVVIQEDATREGDQIILAQNIDDGPYIREKASEFRQGTRMDPRRLRPVDIALVAAMNHSEVPVVRRPVVALVMTGDELAMPGEVLRPGQIVASNGFGLAGLLEAEGAEARLLPIARDDLASLKAVLALTDGADLVVTIGGASVGEHDLVARLGPDDGVMREFYKVAMRPGKPLMAGRLGSIPLIGLPGNPVSAMVCGVVFVLPMVRAMLGLGHGPAPRLEAPLAAGVAANGPREHYMRARLEAGRIRAFDRQDSASLSVLAASDALLIRPPGEPARQPGEPVSYVPL